MNDKNINNIGFVTVNFNNFEVTIKCVDSLLNYNNDDSVVIVDNCSSNDSFEILIKHFSGKQNISVIRTCKNLGYAGGLNVGIRYLRSKYSLCNIFIMNSDLVFETFNNYSYSLRDLDKNVGLVCYKVLNPDLTSQLPYGRYNHGISRNYFHILKFLVTSFLRKAFKTIKKNDYFFDEKEFEYIISGPLMLLTSNFFEVYDYIFSDSFLYLEEFNLFALLKKAALTSVYNQDFSVIHLEQASSIECRNVSNRKLWLIFKSWLKSFKIVLLSKKRLIRHLKKYEAKNKLNWTK